MTEADLRRLRGYYKSLAAQARTLERLDNTPAQVVDGSYITAVKRDVDALLGAFPGIVPALDPLDVFSHDVGRGPYYRLTSLILYLNQVVGRIEAEIESSDTTPVTESREFPYIADGQLRAILRRDYQEVQRAFIAHCWKSTIIVAGGAIEALLLDRLSADKANATGAVSAPKSGDLSRWDLADLIKVAVELKLVNASVEKLSHSVREYRNLVHPGNEMRNKLAFGQEEARIALEVLNLLDRELSK